MTKWCYFSYFFPENRIWHFMQIVSLGDSLHEMSNPAKETVCMKCQILFSGKNKKNISKCRLLKILPRVLSVKICICCLRLKTCSSKTLRMSAAILLYQMNQSVKECYNALKFYKDNLLPNVVSKNCWMSGKQCRPWWDATYCGISFGSTLFAQACLSEYLRYIR